jgi:ankyrin repeat protein
MTAPALALLIGLAAPAAAATPDDLLEAVRKGDLAAVRAALDAGVPVDAPFRYDRTALSFAAGRDNLEVVRLLLERGADANKKDSFYGATPLSWAFDKGNAEAARLLIEHGATAKADLLEDAVDKGSPELVALVLEKVKLGAEDLSGALAAATEAKNDKLAEQLRQAGAVPMKPPDFAIDAAALGRYAGAYVSENGNELRFEVRDAKLVCVTCGPQGMVLGAEDAITFRQLTRPKPRLKFALEGGQPSGFVLDFGDRQVSYKRRAPEPAKDAPKEKP